jgi:hypothetical protein
LSSEPLKTRSNESDSGTRWQSALRSTTATFNHTVARQMSREISYLEPLKEAGQGATSLSGMLGANAVSDTQSRALHLEPMGHRVV